MAKWCGSARCPHCTALYCTVLYCTVHFALSDAQSEAGGGGGNITHYTSMPSVTPGSLWQTGHFKQTGARHFIYSSYLLGVRDWWFKSECMTLLYFVKIVIYWYLMDWWMLYCISNQNDINLLFKCDVQDPAEWVRARLCFEKSRNRDFSFSSVFSICKG